MELYIYEGKEEEKVLAQALEDLKLTENDIIYKKEISKGGLLKKTNVKFSIIKVTDVQGYLKDFLGNIIKEMGIKVTFESSVREKQINIKMFSDNNPILIGKNGQTLTALTTIAKQAVFNQIGSYPYINLDVENYKDKQVKHLERLAKNIAREVKTTKTPVVMENMNSYERRVVHNILNTISGIKTESEGEEPNRHVVVKPKKD